MNKILITGGSGFIGRQIADELYNCNHNVTVVDNIVKDWEVPYTIIQEDYIEFLKTNSIKFDIIIHLAAYHIVEHSVKTPEKYYTNNVLKTKLLLDYMVAKGIKNIIYASSAGIYGNQNTGKLLKEDNL